ncbi:WD repeat-containing protein 2 [Rhodotorula toruloides]
MSLRQCATALARSLTRQQPPARALSSTAASLAPSTPPPPPIQQDTDAVHEWVRTRPRPHTPRNPRTDLRHRPDARYLDSLVGADLSSFDPVLDLHPSQHSVLRAADSTFKARQPNDVLVTTINRVPGEVGYRQKKPGSVAPSKRMRGEEASIEHLSQVTQLSTGEIRNLYRFALVIKRVVNMKAKGKQPSIYALVVTGNGHGLVGCGEGKDDAAGKAVQKAFAQAVRSMDYVERYEERTVWGNMNSNFGTCKIEMRSRPPGFGLRVNPHIHQVAKAAGITDLSAKVYGSRNPVRVIKLACAMLHGGTNPVDMGGFMFAAGQRRNKKVNGMMTAEEVGKARGRKAIDVSHGSRPPPRHPPSPTNSPPKPLTYSRGQCTKLYSNPSGTLLAYGSSRLALLRPLFADSSTAEVRTFGHAQSVNVVKPVGEYYAASGDAGGNVKVWDTTGNYTLKLDSKPLSRINDIACDSESKRLIVVGEGRSAWGASFSLETGSSIGEISGHSKAVNAVAMRPTRPFKAVTGSDDFSVCFLNGVPFKYASTSRRHTRFVQSVAYNPSGSLFVSAGSDGQVFLYDGTSAEERGALVESAGGAAHEKGVFAASWDREGKKVATSSADGSCKLWDVESGKVVQKWAFEGDDVQSQQVGNTFAAEHLVSLSFSGDLNILDVRSPTPSRTLYGHQNPITALSVSQPNFDTFISGDSSGRILATTAEGEVKQVKGLGHKGLVVDVVNKRDGGFVSTAYDDTVKELSKDEFGSSSVPTGSQPKALASGAPASDSLVLATASGIEIFSAPGKSLCTLSLPKGSSSATPTCVATSPSVTAVGTDDSRVHLYSTTDGKHLKSIELRANPTAVAFPPEESGEKVVAIGLATGKVPLYNVETGEIVNARWADISARVTSLAFSPSGSYLAASSLDESIRVYSLKTPSSILSLKNLHKGGASKVCWAGEGKLVSAGADGTIRTLEVKLA